MKFVEFEDMDPKELNGVYVDEADAEEVVTLDNEDGKNSVTYFNCNIAEQF